MDKDNTKAIYTVTANLRPRWESKYCLTLSNMRISISVTEWINTFTESSESDYGAISCDLAEDYWNGRLTDDQMIELLRSDCLLARHAASWAVTDQGYLNASVVELLNIVKHESDFKIKARAICFVEKNREMAFSERRQFLQHFLADEDLKIRELATTSLKTVDSTEKAKLFNPVEKRGLGGSDDETER